MSQPLAKFRVYPDGKYLYAEVNIWPTKKAMYEYVGIGRDYRAVCQYRKAHRSGLFAELNFYKGVLDVETVSHEITHTAFYWAERLTLDLTRDDGERKLRGGGTVLKWDSSEERFCFALSTMVRQFTQKCYDIGLYRDVVEVED